MPLSKSDAVDHRAQHQSAHEIPGSASGARKLRKEMAVGKDTVVTHKPTPELNRNTPEQPAVPDPVQEKKPHNPRRPQ